jgi:hypothetical protein
MTHTMTPDEEYEYYACAENQQPQGPARRRLDATVPVRFTAEILEQVRCGRSRGPFRLIVDPPRRRTRTRFSHMHRRSRRSCSSRQGKPQ